jgi:DNA-binding GntR family transcriptional regulator
VVDHELTDALPLVGQPRVSPSRVKESKARQIHAALKRAIVAGDLRPDAPLDKAELCARFGVSRLPVTVAIDRLAFENLATVEPQRGSYVSRIRVGDVKQWMLVRSALEAEVASSCAERLAPESLARLDRNLAYQRAAMEHGDIDGFYELDVGFHRLMIEGLALDRVGDILESVRTHLDRVRRILLPEPGRMPATFEEHRAIHAAIAAGKPGAAAKAMRRHLHRVLRELELFERSHPDYFSV